MTVRCGEQPTNKALFGAPGREVVGQSRHPEACSVRPCGLTYVPTHCALEDSSILSKSSLVSVVVRVVFRQSRPWRRAAPKEALFSGAVCIMALFGVRA